MRQLLFAVMMIGASSCQTDKAKNAVEEPASPMEAQEVEAQPEVIETLPQEVETTPKVAATKPALGQTPTESPTIKKAAPSKYVPQPGGLPDFSIYSDVKEKKKAFFDFMRPMVTVENNRITKERERIKTIFDTYLSSSQMSEADSLWIIDIAEQLRMPSFDISDPNQRSTLLRKNDIIPSSLFLAQAANESSWGTSRFAREGNNIFGQWCFTPGCGIVPSRRAANETYEVMTFETVNQSVNSYVTYVNGHNAYEKLRVVREQMRAKGLEPSGEAMAVGLVEYSARGEEYVKELQSMIRVNKLEKK